MNVGNRVEVKSKQEYGGRFAGCYGTLVKKSSNGRNTLWGVYIDGEENSASHYGVFWFPQGHLRRLYNEPDVDINIIFESEEQFMPGFKTILIKFPDGLNKNNTYSYACYEDVANGDKVVVHTGHHGFSVAEVADNDPVKPGKVEFGREVVCKVDFTAYDQRKLKTARAAELQKQMDIRVKEMQTLTLYEVMAAKDPALKTLLDEYKALNGFTDTVDEDAAVVETDGFEDK